MMAGTRAAFDSLIQRFDPDTLEKCFDKDLRRSKVLTPLNKIKYWDMLIDLFAELTHDKEKFARLFGEPFAKAYDEKVQRLVSMRRYRNG